MLDGLVDESDPDVDFPNSFHAFQTAEGIRKAHPNKGVLPTCPDGCWGRRGGLALSQYALHPPTAPELCLCPSSCTPLACPVPPSPSDWFHLVGLLHDLGKVLALAGEPQVRRWVEGGQQGRARGSLRSRLWTPTWGASQLCLPTAACPSVPSGQSSETPSQLAAVPRPLWSSVTAPSRTTLISRTPCTGAAPLPSLAVVLPPPPASGLLFLSPHLPSPPAARSLACTSLTVGSRTSSCPGVMTVRPVGGGDGGDHLELPLWVPVVTSPLPQSTAQGTIFNSL